MGMLLKVVFSAMINFTVGMICSIFVFIFKLPWILADYKPGWVRLSSFDFCPLFCCQTHASMH